MTTRARAVTTDSGGLKAGGRCEQFFLLCASVCARETPAAAEVVVFRPCKKWARPLQVRWFVEVFVLRGLRLQTPRFDLRVKKKALKAALKAAALTCT